MEHEHVNMSDFKYVRTLKQKLLAFTDPDMTTGTNVLNVGLLSQTATMANISLAPTLKMTVSSETMEPTN